MINLKKLILLPKNKVKVIINMIRKAGRINEI